MKIVYLHQYFNRPSDAGGGRSYLMARRLAEAGHDVHVISSDRNPSSYEKAWATEAIDGFTVHWYPVPYSNSMAFRARIVAFFQFAIRAASRARSTRADLVFATSTPLTIAIPAMYATLFRRTPFVLEVRDLWPEIPIALGALKGWLPIALARLLERTAYRRSRHVIALSPGMKAGVVRRGISAERVTVLPNVADLDFFREDQEAGNLWRDQLPWLNDRPLVVHCGTIGRVNGVRYLVRLAEEALKQGYDTCFATVGTGGEEGIVRALASELGVLNINFFMLGAMPKHEIARVYSASALTLCLVIPVKELEHNSANKFFESLAAGRPLAINYGGWHHDLLTKHDCGIRLPADDMRAAATSLATYLSSPAEVKARGENAKELARREFSLDSISTRLILTLESVFAATKRSA